MYFQIHGWKICRVPGKEKLSEITGGYSKGGNLVAWPRFGRQRVSVLSYELLHQGQWRRVAPRCLLDGRMSNHGVGNCKSGFAQLVRFSGVLRNSQREKDGP